MPQEGEHGRLAGARRSDHEGGPVLPLVEVEHQRRAAIDFELHQPVAAEIRVGLWPSPGRTEDQAIVARHLCAANLALVWPDMAGQPSLPGPPCPPPPLHCRTTAGP